jgi:arylsulfatase A-like enzyme
MCAMCRTRWNHVLPLPLPIVCVLTLHVSIGSAASDSSPPNIVIILADDLGYGDVQCYNPQRGKIRTPNIDRLASGGMRFTDAHSSSGVCSPSRYTLLTGRYHWRTRLQQGIVGVFGPPLIAPDRLTVAGLVKRHGYRTACIGKWHLGWDWPIPADKSELFRAKPGPDDLPGEEQRALWKAVFSQPIPGGPTTRGFDGYFGTDVPNWPPYCFVENDRTDGIPSVFLPRKLLSENQASLPGPALEGWTLEPILPTLGDRACDFISRSAQQAEPFFLYMPLTAPHTPLAVTPDWQGKSELVPYADFVMQTDAVVGRVLETLEKSGVSGRTLVVFTSDNGCAPYVGVPEMERHGHFPSGPLRGYKSDVWEGGHRIPFIVRWPGVVGAGTSCDQLAHHADIMATVSEVVGARLPDNAGEDSFSLLPLLRGGTQPVRHSSVNQSANGLPSIREGSWKLIFGAGSGGWGAGRDELPAQLYNLAEDIGETRNLYKEKPDVVERLTKLMAQTVASGRSTPGEAQPNDKPFDWQRFMREGNSSAAKSKTARKTKAAANPQTD